MVVKCKKGLYNFYLKLAEHAGDKGKDMLEAWCPHCGLRRFGWALNNPRYRSCPNCGTGLQITGGDREIVQDPPAPLSHRLDEPEPRAEERIEPVA